MNAWPTFDNSHLLNKEHTVYRLFAADGYLLYVGCTSNLRDRLANHKTHKDWWPQVARVESETYPDRARGLWAEREAIVTEAPRYNQNARMVPDPDAPPPPDLKAVAAERQSALEEAARRVGLHPSSAATILRRRRAS